MTDLHFDPLYPEHAVERCSWSLVFTENLPGKLYQKAAAEVRQAAANNGLRPVPIHGIQFNAATGQVQPVNENSAPMQFMTPNGALNLSLAPNSLGWANSRYVRWESFFSQIKDFPLEFVESAMQVISISALKIEYWDRFVWSGSWDDFDAWSLLRRDSDLVAVKASKSESAWHSHCGWFETSNDNARRLVNLNIDVADLVRSNGPAPSIGIYSMIQDNFVVPGRDIAELEFGAIEERSSEIHDDLKAILKAIISDEMAERISLFAEASDGNAR